MNRNKRRTLDRRLVGRDGYVCGAHVGGCGMDCLGPDADLDHVIPQAFFRDTKALNSKQYDSLWNVQRMHKGCNNEAKGGFLAGFPVFKCECHWLQIRERDGQYALEVSYRPHDGGRHRVVVVPYGQFDIGDGKVSDPKGLLADNGEHVVVGYIQAPPDRGMSISSVTVDLDAAFGGGRKSFAFVGRAKRGTLKRGDNAHVFPLLSPDEVAAFNQAERDRVQRGGAVDEADNLLVKLNSAIVPLEAEYDEVSSGEAER